MSNVINGNVPDTGLLKGSVSGLLARDGYSAYEIALKNGFEGTEEEWLLSLKGEKGERGSKGDRGEKGADGTVSFEDLTPEQVESLRGEDGVPGVYIGSGNMPDGYSVQIDPNGDSFSADDIYHKGNKPTAADVGARPNTWMPTAADVGAVNKAGDTMTGNLLIKKSNSVTAEFIPDTSGVMIQAYSSWSKRKFLSIPSDVAGVGYEDVHFVDMDTTSGKNGWFVVHHGRNKPSGSYTGNETAREIDVGGIGNLVMVRSGKGMALVTTGGAFAFSFTTNTVNGAAVYYIGGKLIIYDASAKHEVFNAAGVTYSYQVL